MSRIDQSSTGGRPVSVHVPPGVLAKSLTIGAFTGAVGVIVGAATAVIRARPAGIPAILAGAHWFALGTCYYGSKTVLASNWGGEIEMAKSEKVLASTVAGGIAGAASALIVRGPRTMLPHGLAFSILGAGGQAVSNSMAERTPGPKRDWLASRWSPLTRLSDEEYEKILEEKILRLEAEIALVEDKISLLQAEAKDSARDST